MASPAQIAANQLNSRKSTGPTTPQGRAKSSNADAQAERTVAGLSFGSSPEGEALRNHPNKRTSGLFRGMANYRKHKAGASSRSVGASGVGRHGTREEGSDAPSEAN